MRKRNWKCRIMYNIEIEKRCLRELKNIDKPMVIRAFDVIENIIAKNPYIGKQLTGKYKGLFSYRFSNHRIVYEIQKEKVTILILRIRHRKDVYDGL